MGNSCHVPVIAWLLKEFFAPLGLTPLKSLADVIQATAPGRDTQLQSYLRRPPLQMPKVVRPEVAEEVLTKKLVNFVSVKGEDLLLQADSENQVKFHRLRSSVPDCGSGKLCVECPGSIRVTISMFWKFKPCIRASNGRFVARGRSSVSAFD